MNKIPANVAGWLASPKIDGVRCLFTGSAFVSRHGRIFTPPASWLAGMPACRLDGELYAGIQSFDELVSAIQRKRNPWENVTFQVFDLAQLRQPIESRLAMLAGLDLPGHCQIVPHRPLADHADLDRMESDIVARGGEGVCIRPPGSYYAPSNFIKVKRIFPDLNRSVLD
jgi:DNA ligase 1